MIGLVRPAHGPRTTATEQPGFNGLTGGATGHIPVEHENGADEALQQLCLLSSIEAAHTKLDGVGAIDSALPQVRMRIVHTRH